MSNEQMTTEKRIVDIAQRVERAKNLGSGWRATDESDCVFLLSCIAELDRQLAFSRIEAEFNAGCATAAQDRLNLANYLRKSTKNPCGHCDDGEACANQHGVCSRNGGRPHAATSNSNELPSAGDGSEKSGRRHSDHCVTMAARSSEDGIVGQKRADESIQSREPVVSNSDSEARASTEQINATCVDPSRPLIAAAYATGEMPKLLPYLQ